MKTRSAGKQPFGISMPGIYENLFSKIAFNDLAFIHYGDLISYLAYYRKVVCDEDDSHLLFLLQIFDEL